MVIDLSLNLNLIIYMYVCMWDFDIVMNSCFGLLKKNELRNFSEIVKWYHN